MRMFMDRVRWLGLMLVLTLGVLAAPVLAQDAKEGAAQRTEEEEEIYAHPVSVDGQELFKVRGSSALPATDRAAHVAKRIIEVAEKSDDRKVFMEIRPGELGLNIYADGELVSVTTQADSDFEEFDLEILTQLQLEAIERAINTYRTSRTDEAFTANAITAAVWTLVFAGYCALFLFCRKLFPNWVAGLARQRTRGVGQATGDVLKSDAIASVVRFAVRGLFNLVLLVGFYYYLSLVLLSFPQTKLFAQILIQYVTDPVISVLKAFVSYLPNLLTIAVLAFLARALLKTIRLFFENLEAGVIKWSNFEKEWIWPTYNLIQITVILMTMVICFPYVPGAKSAAFQGLTIFLGVVLSLGSNTVVANALAGLFVLYKRSMRVGDRIRVGEHYGDVIEIKLMETYIKSIKNELISIPNSTLISSEVLNYSSKIDGRGLLLHSTVGIGYEEPREKIEAMLIEASRRTSGLKKNPPPFVLMEGLGDFGINYQINAFTTRGSSLPLLRSQLHKNIVDVFNENKVAIMTPAYEGDTEDPKVAPAIWEGELAPNSRAGDTSGDAKDKKD
ncbi:mechanosensitive ion channel [Shimia thalassica]|uniref:mechanosensitive ion channel family protein n=1 Tax=Shimia thalassica TaxID=1715693 RepID=UPI0027341FFC|nr:mechanosensitive ion channel domain-containing protein [Shimia thalassica]MDP2578734.1 mechanosensitive ion channel [Shimia thalassica]